MRQRIQALADDLKVVVTSYNYDSETMVLEKILDAREDQVIVLCWNSKFQHAASIRFVARLYRSLCLLLTVVA